jgi:hypothetical protein
MIAGPALFRCKVSMVIRHYTRDLPYTILLLPYVQEFESAGYLLPVFHMRERMLAGFDSAVIFNGVNFKAARYQFAGEYKILFKYSAKACHCLVVIAYADVILKKFEGRIEECLHRPEIF